MSLTVGVEVPPNDRAELEGWLRSPSLRAGLAQRAPIVLLAADGVGTNEIVHRVGVSKPAVIRWKRRYAAEGVAAWTTGRSRAGRCRSIRCGSCPEFHTFKSRPPLLFRRSGPFPSRERGLSFPIRRVLPPRWPVSVHSPVQRWWS